ncbi:MAG: hypothetical protein CMG63_01120 [Candidatus Marinimicrobia bacterium]|nr:hypothetical protein [Candidatus Neomarinimicrobiota bacterium]
MKKYLFALILISTSLGQDILITQAGTKYQGKMLEVEYDKIQFQAEGMISAQTVDKIYKWMHDNATSKLLDENEGYDFVVNPKVKSKTATIIPGITQKMERVTAKLGRYR